MCEFNVLINAPLMGMSLYERTNRKEDCEGLILGSYRRVTKSNVDDTADRSDFIEHELIIRRLPICGVRGTFYDQTCQIDFTKLNGLLKTELGLNDDENDVEKLELLGWFISRRVFSPEFLNVYREISKSLNEAKCWLTADKKESLQFSYGGPLFLCIYERFLNGEEKFKYDVQECKYQMYCYQSISDQLKSIKLKIVNVGDTSHVDYEAINVGLNLHNATNSAFSYVPKSMLENLTPELEKTAIDLAQNSKKLIADEIERLEIVEKRLNGIQNGNGADCSTDPTLIFYEPFSMLTDAPARALDSQSWELIDGADVDCRGQKREKCDQSCSSSGNNSDELETSLNQRPPPSIHVTKRSRGQTGESNYAVPPMMKTKGRSRNIPDPK